MLLYYLYNTIYMYTKDLSKGCTLYIVRFTMYSVQCAQCIHMGSAGCFAKSLLIL